MTRYYIDLKEYGETANIKDVCSDTLKEVINDFYIELQKRDGNNMIQKYEIEPKRDYSDCWLEVNQDNINGTWIKAKDLFKKEMI